MGEVLGGAALSVWPASKNDRYTLSDDYLEDLLIYSCHFICCIPSYTFDKYLIEIVNGVIMYEMGTMWRCGYFKRRTIY